MMSEFRWRHWDVKFSCDFEKLREKLLILKKIIDADNETFVPLMQELYQEPVKEKLIQKRIQQTFQCLD